MKVVIFCGGYGTRMWPASRKSFPKQFYPLIKGKSFFQLTISRFRKIFEPQDIFVSTESKYVTFVKKQASYLPSENIIAEPERRDNLAAIGLVTSIIHKRFPNEVMLISWSDHLIREEDEFLRAFKTAGEYAGESGKIVSVNEKPKYPSVHHGWVKLGKTITEYKGQKIVRIIKHFEKPDLKTAKKFFLDGNYLINTGYRAWRTDVMLGYFKKFAPEIYQGLMKIAGRLGEKDFSEFLAREYHKFPKDSIETGIFEKLPEDAQANIPVQVGWEDSGTWELLYRALRVNEDENVLEGGPILEHLDSSGNLIIGQKGKMIGIIGLKNMVIIDTKDGLLVCDMGKTDKVKELFKILEKSNPKYVE
jgi:mannose-1-phosphate guanylyltransferase